MSVLFQVKRFIIRPCNIGYTMLIINMFHMVSQLASNQHVKLLKLHADMMQITASYDANQKHI